MACRSPGERERGVSYTQSPHVMQVTVAIDGQPHQKCTITFCRFCSRLSKLYTWCVGEIRRERKEEGTGREGKEEGTGGRRGKRRGEGGRGRRRGQGEGGEEGGDRGREGKKEGTGGRGEEGGDRGKEGKEEGTGAIACNVNDP